MDSESARPRGVEHTPLTSHPPAVVHMPCALSCPSGSTVACALYDPEAEHTPRWSPRDGRARKPRRAPTWEDITMLMLC